MHRPPHLGGVGVVGDDGHAQALGAAGNLATDLCAWGEGDGSRAWGHDIMAYHGYVGARAWRAVYRVLSAPCDSICGVQRLRLGVGGDSAARFPATPG